jgi:hypothetical protein
MIKQTILLLITNSFRSAIKQSLMNNPKIDLTKTYNVNLLTDDILNNIGQEIENMYTILKQVKNL